MCERFGFPSERALLDLSQYDEEEQALPVVVDYKNRFMAELKRLREAEYGPDNAADE